MLCIQDNSFTIISILEMSNDIEKANRMLENSNIKEVMAQVDEMDKQAIDKKKILVWELVQNLLAHKNNSSFTVGISYQEHLVKAEEIFDTVVKPQIEQLEKQEWYTKKSTTEINTWI